MIDKKLVTGTSTGSTIKAELFAQGSDAKASGEASTSGLGFRISRTPSCATVAPMSVVASSCWVAERPNCWYASMSVAGESETVYQPDEDVTVLTLKTLPDGKTVTGETISTSPGFSDWAELHSDRLMMSVRPSAPTIRLG